MGLWVYFMIAGVVYHARAIDKKTARTYGIISTVVAVLISIIGRLSF